MGFFDAPAPPKTELGRYRILATTAGVRVSPLVLGAMSIGEAWDFMGTMKETESYKLLDSYYDLGGNFIDTANNYQNEQSETIIGDWMKLRDNRDMLFIATKYTINYRRHHENSSRSVNYGGNSKKSMFISLEASLKKLQTSYIDLFYVHLWDWSTSIPEIIDSLDILVKQGKVLYLGVSDTPAWVVSAANEYARAHGKTPFSVYQGRWNLADRAFEREIVPMARHYGMALCPWNVLMGGQLQTKAQREARAANSDGGRGDNPSPKNVAISDALEKIASSHGSATIQQIALAYIRSKAPNVFPIIGGRKVSHLEDNIKALDVVLTKEEISSIDSIQPFDLGFPLDMIGDDPRTGAGRPPIVGAILGADLAFTPFPENGRYIS
ncbi:hypothetical protein FG05_00053 [Fusarium graminearum]|nr:hypothetical protein FG05_00053 [Fusarium graminearum]